MLRHVSFPTAMSHSQWSLMLPATFSGNHTTHFPSPYLIMITAVAVIEPLLKRVWYTIQVGIRRMYSGGTSPENSPATRLPLEVVETIIAHLAHDVHGLRACTLTCSSWYIAAVPHLHRALPIGPRSRIQTFEWPSSPLHTHTAGLLPLEVVEMVMAHLICDTRSLHACTLTCHSWYIAAVPHLHHTLTIQTYPFVKNIESSLQQMHMLGLLPFVKRFRVWGLHDEPVLLSPTLLNCRILRHFSALTSVRELEVEYLDIPSFMPQIRRYFTHFLPTLRSLSLRGPKGSCRQIIYFIGLFQHLEDLRFVYNWGGWGGSQHEPADDLTLTPPFVPPLRGSLTMSHFMKVGLLEAMIYLFRGIRFRHMCLLSVYGVQLLLGACAKTLETLELYPLDPLGEQLFANGAQALANDFVAPDLDLSQNKSLRTLNILASCVGLPMGPDTTPVLKRMLSTIAPSVLFDVVIYYSEGHFCGIESGLSNWPYLREPSQTEREVEASYHHRRFKALREMHKVRAFRLVLCANVWGSVGSSYPVRMLKEAIAEEKARGGFADFSSDPEVMYFGRSFRAGFAQQGRPHQPCPHRY